MTAALDRYAPDVLACWVYWEALRRIGFASDDIFISIYHEAVLEFDVCGVVLRTQCREFNINAAKLTRDGEEFIAAWVVFCQDVLDGRIGDRELQPIWDARPADVTMLPAGLVEKGFRLSRGEG